MVIIILNKNNIGSGNPGEILLLNNNNNNIKMNENYGGSGNPGGILLNNNNTYQYSKIDILLDWNVYLRIQTVQRYTFFSKNWKCISPNKKTDRYTKQPWNRYTFI